MVVQGGTVRTSFSTVGGFVNVVRQKFTSQGRPRRLRDKLRMLVQKSSVSSCVSEFGNIVIVFPNISEGKTWTVFGLF